MKFLALIGVFANAALASIWGGYVFSVLWSWFVVVAFGLPTLSIPLAIGVTMIARYVTMEIPKQKDDNEVGYAIFMSWLKPLIFLGVGYIVTLFM